jgi:hypothetical protein
MMQFSNKYDYNIVTVLAIISVVQVPLIRAGAGLAAGWGTLVRLGMILLLCLVCFWLPATRLFLPRTRIDLRKRSRLASLILGDPSSVLWVQSSR